MLLDDFVAGADIAAAEHLCGQRFDSRAFVSEQSLATGGVEGIAMAVEHKPALVLMDIRMPDLSGTEALKLLREDSRTAEIPIVALTSSTMRGDEERFIAEGFDGYLAKPISVREFPDQVRGFLKE